MLARIEAAELALAELGGLVRGTLPVMASQTVAGYWLPRHLVGFRRAYPGVAVRLSIGNTAQVAAAVRGGTAEIGFVEGARVRVLHEGLFGRDPMAVMVDDTRIALRRREAADILVRFDSAARA